MDLDRGMLARLDRRLLAGLGVAERFHMVRVPVTPAKWSTWKRYCDTAGISMGRGIAALVDHELALVFDHSKEGAVSLFEERAQQHMAEREAALTKRERELRAAEERARRWSDHLREKEQELEIREWRVDAVTKLSTQPTQVAKTGRNERCPCGSGLKYKHCHGLAGRPT